MYFVKNEKTKTIYTSFWCRFDEIHLEQVMAVLVVVVAVG